MKSDLHTPTHFRVSWAITVSRKLRYVKYLTYFNSCSKGQNAVSGCVLSIEIRVGDWQRLSKKRELRTSKSYHIQLKTTIFFLHFLEPQIPRHLNIKELEYTVKKRNNEHKLALRHLQLAYKEIGGVLIRICIAYMQCTEQIQCRPCNLHGYSWLNTL